MISSVVGLSLCLLAFQASNSLCQEDNVHLGSVGLDYSLKSCFSWTVEMEFCVPFRGQKVTQGTHAMLATVNPPLPSQAQEGTSKVAHG